MNYFKLNPADTVNGKGVRVSLFVSGCTHNCKGCFAKAEQNFNYGERFTDDHFSVLLSCLDKDYISGLSILGGDPLAPKNIDFIKTLCKGVKEEFPNKTIYIWTGYLFEEIDKELLEYVDGIVDGKFEEDKYSPELIGRGSSNQRTFLKHKGKWIEVEDIYSDGEENEF